MNEPIIDWEVVKSHPKLSHLTTALWLQWIVKRINHNKNFLCVVVGDTGSGKSEAAIAAAEMLDPTFSIDKICFSIESFLKIIKEPSLKKGSCLVLDELGLSAGRRNYFTQANKDFISLLQEFRHKNLIVFFTVPDLGFIDSGSVKLIHSIWEMAGINFDRKIAKVKAKYMKKKPSSDDKAEGRFLTYNPNFTGKRKIKFIFLKRPTVILRNLYEKKKLDHAEEFYNTLLKKYNVKDKERPPILYTPMEEKVRQMILADKTVKASVISRTIGLPVIGSGKLKAKVLNKMADEEQRLHEDSQGK